MSMPRSLFVALPGLVVTFAGTACDRSAPVAVYPVRGQVFYEGKPAVRARVSFHALGNPELRSGAPMALVEEDGSFRLSTRRAYDGIPAGEYAVTITWPSATKQQNGFNAGPDLLDGRYADPNSTPLRARVSEGQNELEPIHLK
jgi:hypothetical protein